MWDTYFSKKDEGLFTCVHPGAQFPGARIQVAIIAPGGDQIEVGLPCGEHEQAQEDLTVTAPGD